ncbi:hypothetical protein [Streptomyces sp. NPDC056405]|uniref:hypothetical protein n=1 Tax=Streptomyces sp. NPDC056405 TaxID=3345811 RepID=UPI0035DA0AF0
MPIVCRGSSLISKANSNAHNTGNSEASDRLAELLKKLPQDQQAVGRGFGSDIDEAHGVLLDPTAGPDARTRAFTEWLRRHQPCLFGRLAARQGQGVTAAKGLGMDFCWIDDTDLAYGTEHVTALVQQERRRWKERAARGESSAFLVVFNSRTLAHAAPSSQLAELCGVLADTYLVEQAPVAVDTVYTEAVPLRCPDGRTRLFKASTQLFYTGAHERRNHAGASPAASSYPSTHPATTAIRWSCAV